MGHGLIYAVHHPHRQNVVQKLRVEVRLRCRGAGDDGRRTLIQPQLHRHGPGGLPVIHQRLLQHGQELLRHRLMHQTHLLGVAHRGATGLGVDDDGQCLLQIGVLIHIHMADTGTGLDTGNGGVLHTAADQARPATGDQQIHQPVGPHQIGGALVAGVVHDVDDLRIPSGGGNALLQGLHDGLGGAVGLPAAAQNADVAALHRQRRRIGGDVGTALIDNGDEAHGHLLLADGHAVGPGDLRQDAARVIRQGRQGPDALCHTRQSLFIQIQPIQHHIADGSPCLLHVPAVLRQNGGGAGHETVRHGPQQSVLSLCVPVADAGPRRPRLFQDIQCGHRSFLPARKRVPTG